MLLVNLDTSWGDVQHSLALICRSDATFPWKTMNVLHQRVSLQPCQDSANRFQFQLARVLKFLRFCSIKVPEYTTNVLQP